MLVGTQAQEPGGHPCPPPFGSGGSHPPLGLGRDTLPVPHLPPPRPTCSPSLSFSSKTNGRQDAEEGENGQGRVAILKKRERKRSRPAPTPLLAPSDREVPVTYRCSSSEVTLFFQFWFGFNPPNKDRRCLPTRCGYGMLSLQAW